jgi:hypothetical protein
MLVTVAEARPDPIAQPGLLASAASSAASRARCRSPGQNGSAEYPAQNIAQIRDLRKIAVIAKVKSIRLQKRLNATEQ